MALELDGEEATTPPRPPPPPSVRPPPPPSNEQDAMRAWLRVQTDANAPDGAGPCQRSLHVAAVWRDRMLCFGGYDGSHRVNDCWEFDFGKRAWSTVRPSSGTPPSPRDRHVAVVWGGSFYVFAGFDGTSRVNDFHEFAVAERAWSPVRALSGLPPSPRHSHAAVVHRDSFYVFGGYDGSYRCDFHEFNFVTRAWAPITGEGRVPRARYRATCVVHDQAMYLFGGHDVRRGVLTPSTRLVSIRRGRGWVCF